MMNSGRPRSCCSHPFISPLPTFLPSGQWVALAPFGGRGEVSKAIPIAPLFAHWPDG